jgi:type IV pilus assembly protein PilN
MARINLLPWRETERRRKQREFLVLTVTALVATLMVGVGLHFQVEHLIATQKSRNDFLRTEISQLEEKIREIRELEKTKANLLARMEVIQQLQQSRPEIVHLFDELVTAIPEGVFLTGVQQKERTVVLEGRAESNARVSAFMRNIEASAWIGNPRLLLIEHKDKTGTGLSHFKLQFTQKRPDAEPDEAEPA